MKPELLKVTQQSCQHHQNKRCRASSRLEHLVLVTRFQAACSSPATASSTDTGAPPMHLLPMLTDRLLLVDQKGAQGYLRQN